MICVCSVRACVVQSGALVGLEEGGGGAGGVRAWLVCVGRVCGVNVGFGPRVWLAQCVTWRVRLCVCVCEGVRGGGGEDGADEWVGWRVGEGEVGGGV